MSNIKINNSICKTVIKQGSNRVKKHTLLATKLLYKQMQELAIRKTQKITMTQARSLQDHHTTNTSVLASTKISIIKKALIVFRLPLLEVQNPHKRVDPSNGNQGASVKVVGSSRGGGAKVGHREDRTMSTRKKKIKTVWLTWQNLNRTDRNT